MVIDKRGFTIVELLIVIVVIAILAAITVVAYNGIKDRAENTTAQNDLVAMAKKIELEAANSGTYATASTNTSIKITRSVFDTTENNLYYCRHISNNKYAIAARTKSGKNYQIVNGTISESATKLYAAATCTLVGADTSNVVFGWNAATGLWADWAAAN